MTVAGAEPVPIVRLEGVSKSFAGLKALDGVDLTLNAGEVHGLLGQNGCGKSTLIKILAGYHEADHGGRILVHGEQMRDLGASGGARHRFTFVHQNLGLVPAMTVAENIGLTMLSTGRLLRPLQPRALRQWAAALLQEFGVDVSPDAVVEHLDGTSRALVAIVRAVDALRSGNEGVAGALMVLDEPTVFLPRSGVDRLFELVRDVVGRGAAVLFVSHDLNEVSSITDRYTVLRDGRAVGSGTTATADSEDLISLIVGRSVKAAAQTTAVKDDEVRLDVTSLQTAALAPLDLRLRRGEVVGLTGLMGSAFAEPVYALAGARGRLRGAGEVDGRPLPLGRWNPRRARAAGLALVPGDRSTQGGVGELSVGENLALPVLGEFRRRGLVDGRGLEEHAARLNEEYDVKPRDPAATYSSLSGGNQQKVLMAKWLQTCPQVLLLHEPTQGVDVGSREEIHRTVARAAAAEGMAVLCASTDYSELARLCDRVLVFDGDSVVGELGRGQISEDAIAEHVLRGGSSDAMRTRRTVA